LGVLMPDFIIIGGGVAGLSAAAALSELGSAVLFETEHALAFHASGRSAAMFLADYGNTTVRALNYASQERLEQWGILNQRRMMLVAKASERSSFQREFSDFGMTQVTVDEAQSLLPILNPKVASYAAVREDVFDLDTDLLIQHFRRQVLENGAVLQLNAEVTAIQRDTAYWTISTSQGTFEAPTLINAAGAWADEVAQLAGLSKIGLQPYRRSMARLPAPDGLETRDWPFTDGVNEAWYAKPDAGSWIVSPSEENPTPPHDAWADDMVLAEGLARYEEMMTVPVTHIQANWAGLRTFAPDRALVIGPDPVEPSFVWLAGQGGYGFQTAIAAADLLYDRVTNATSRLGDDIGAALAPDRFR
jgi:glycine/D-amino acid oxidase-like deaminating enzyme